MQSRRNGNAAGESVVSQERKFSPLAQTERWSLTTLWKKLVKIGAKAICHGRCVAFQFTEVAVPRELFWKILGLIDDLRPRPGPA